MTEHELRDDRKVSGGAGGRGRRRLFLFAIVRAARLAVGVVAVR